MEIKVITARQEVESWPVSEAIVVALGAFISVYLFFWPQFTSGFSVMYGDAFDGVIESILISHWHWVFQGLRHWNEPMYLLPHPDALGYNDGYFLYGVIGSLFRLFGVDVLRASEYTHVTVKLIGYFSIYALLRRINHRPLINVGMSIVFSISVNAITGAHEQLLAVAFAPAMVWLGLRALDQAEAGHRWRFAIRASVWAVLYGAWLMTGFYMAFFFALFVIVTIAVMALVERGFVRRYAEVALANRLPLAMIIGVAIVSIVPFLAVYLPKLRETGGQSVATAIAYAQYPYDVVNFGPGSMLWGGLWTFINSMHAVPLFRDHEQMTGFTPFFLVLFVVAGVSLRSFVRTPRSNDVVMLSLFVSTLVLMLLVIRIGDKSLWWLVYHFVPGGKGLRVTSRMFIFLSFPMTLVIGYWLHGKEKVGAAFLLLILSVLIFEQIDLAPKVNLNVNDQLSHIAHIPTPPAACKAFYGIHPRGYASTNKTAEAMYVNVQSMLVADRVNIPTINGAASFLPSDWDFLSTPEDTYPQRAAAFAQRNGVNGLCEYDISSRAWTVIN